VLVRLRQEVQEVPRGVRPDFAPGYGISQDAEGVVEWDWADERLARSRNYWITTVSANGAPHAVPVWGVWLDGALVFGTDPAAVKARNLERDPRVVVHLESGDEVVILHARAEPVPAEMGDAVLDAYEAKYGMRMELGDGWFLIRPHRALAWRETDYPSSATRFDLSS
jgi:Pyridoxamine 5'-phosphate oxidase